MIARQTVNVNGYSLEDIDAMAAYVESRTMTAEQEYRQGKIQSAYDAGRMAAFHGDDPDRAAGMYEFASPEELAFWDGFETMSQQMDDTAARQAEEADEREEQLNGWRS